jgi:hypothetical protein
MNIVKEKIKLNTDCQIYCSSHYIYNIGIFGVSTPILYSSCNKICKEMLLGVIFKKNEVCLLDTHDAPPDHKKL